MPPSEIEERTSLPFHSVPFLFQLIFHFGVDLDEVALTFEGVVVGVVFFELHLHLGDEGGGALAMKRVSPGSTSVLKRS